MARTIDKHQNATIRGPKLKQPIFPSGGSPRREDRLHSRGVRIALVKVSSPSPSILIGSGFCCDISVEQTHFCGEADVLLISDAGAVAAGTVTGTRTCRVTGTWRATCRVWVVQIVTGTV